MSLRQATGPTIPRRGRGTCKRSTASVEFRAMLEPDGESVTEVALGRLPKTAADN
jgi:hypothetical protein